jgi:hypothetical protein
MKRIFFRFLFVGMMLFLWGSQIVQATVINTGNLTGTDTVGNELVSNIKATPRSMIRFEIGGAHFTTSGSLTVSATVDAVTPAVISGTTTDQSFNDDAVGAAFYGYYLSTGVISTGQTLTNMTIKIQKGAGETSGRSYYLLGNGTTVPNDITDLTIAPAAATVIATTTKNAIHCGPNYSANGLTDTATDCAAGTTIANMDVTQFTKILWSDPPGTAIVSQLSFSAVVQ